MANRTVRRTQQSVKSATFQWTECFWAGSYDDGALRDCIRSRVLISTRIKNHDYLSRGRLLLGAIMTAIPECTNFLAQSRDHANAQGTALPIAYWCLLDLVYDEVVGCLRLSIGSLIPTP
ncbi:hypothetical protein PGTUg99_032819 [Puccinia graminis f. sp. tritici]|uniref:Uncharacterized protein n=1 Tax=Puccinia graminis f. sp. tritici TaxID=56615 RepID=A0A5B0SG77_PUCGR|nr:hypothetical protein PGTUg99_032819 [Puccinia graminis f. sp. tritici]